jgi:excisionase family DNA binding protein
MVVEAVELADLGHDVVRANVGPGQTELFFRILFTTNFDAMLEDPAAAGSGRFVEVVRNALMHEAQLNELVHRAAPDLGVDGLISLLGNAFAFIEAKSVAPQAHFTEAEIDELNKSGLLGSKSAHRPSRTSGRTATEFAALITDSLSVPQAADLLKVDQSRIRQRLTERTLYGIKVGRTWRLPRFQFKEHGQIRGLDQVLPQLPSTLHPVALQRWLTSPSSDLELDDGAISPLEWLEATGDAATAVAIARDL